MYIRVVDRVKKAVALVHVKCSVEIDAMFQCLYKEFACRILY